PALLHVPSHPRSPSLPHRRIHKTLIFESFTVRLSVQASPHIPRPLSYIAYIYFGLFSSAHSFFCCCRITLFSPKPQPVRGTKASLRLFFGALLQTIILGFFQEPCSCLS